MTPTDWAVAIATGGALFVVSDALATWRVGRERKRWEAIADRLQLSREYRAGHAETHTGDTYVPSDSAWQPREGVDITVFPGVLVEADDVPSACPHETTSVATTGDGAYEVTTCLDCGKVQNIDRVATDITHPPAPAPREH